MINRLIYSIGEKYRNPSLGKWYKFLKGSESWTRQELLSYQEKRLLEIIKYAKENSPFYCDLYKNIEVNSIEDVKWLPLIDGDTLRKFNDNIHVKKYKEKIFKAKTSGSSGLSLEFDRNESADSFSRAAIKRGYSWHNVKPWDLNLYYWGFDTSKLKGLKTKLLDFFQNRFRIFNFSNQSIQILRKKSKDLVYIHGYSSMIYETAKLCKGKNLSFPKLKMIKATSEKILDVYRSEIFNVFGVPVISEYGATESGIISFECEKGKQHVTMEGVYTEVINNELVITNLHLKSFPIIRYKLGDIVEIDHDNFCTCGKEHILIKSIHGRIGKKVFGKKNVYPSFTFYYIFKNLSLKGISLNYQVFQEKKGELNFYIEQDCHNFLNEINSEVDKYFGNDIVSKIIDNHEFIVRKEKKMMFITKLD